MKTMNLMISPDTDQPWKQKVFPKRPLPHVPKSASEINTTSPLQIHSPSPLQPQLGQSPVGPLPQETEPGLTAINNERKA
jgi:hypothetical protein